VANESGASTQPWRTPASILNHELWVPPVRTQLTELSYSTVKSLTILSGIPSLVKSSHNAGRLRESNIITASGGGETWSVILIACHYVILSFILSLCRITHERGNGCLPNIVGMSKGTSFRSILFQYWSLSAWINLEIQITFSGHFGLGRVCAVWMLLYVVRWLMWFVESLPVSRNQPRKDITVSGPVGQSMRDNPNALDVRSQAWFCDGTLSALGAEISLHCWLGMSSL